MDRNRIRRERRAGYLPSRSVKNVNMKNASQSGVGSLNAPRMRGLSASPERRSSERFGFFAAIAAKIAMQQVDHGPKMAAFFYVHLKNIAQVVQRRAAHAQQPLLFDGGRLGVTLRDDHAAQSGAVFTGNFLPGRLALMHAEIYLAAGIARLQKNSPAIFGHAHVAELRPAVGFHARSRAQIDFERVAFAGAHVVPPIHVSRLPVFQCALQHAVPAEVHVVGDFFRVINHDGLLKTMNFRIVALQNAR